MESKHIIPPQLDYGRSDCSFPKYKFSRVVPLSGSQAVTIPNSSTAETLLEIPTNVMNLAQSYLFAEVTYPAQAAGTFGWAYLLGMPLISEVDLYTRSGIYLCQLPNFQNYMKIVRPLFTPWGEYITNDLGSYLAISNAASGTVPNVTPNNNPGTTNFLETAYIANENNFGGLAAATAFTITMNFPLSAIKRTIFELNKDIVFPDIIVMRILWGPTNKAMFGGTSNVFPQVGAIAATGTITLANLTLFLATEKNEDLAQSVRGLVNSPGGMNILVDYPYSYKQQLSGTSQSISLRFNRGHGKNILGIISAPFNSTESSNSAFDHFNVLNVNTALQTATGAKITNYFSQLDNIRLEDITLVCGNEFQDDYRQNKEFMASPESLYSHKLEGSPYMSQQIYNNNWFHYDRFYEADPFKCYDSTNYDRGLSLVVERKYDLLAVTPSVTQNWYSFALVQKYLHIGAQMIQYQ